MYCTSLLNEDPPKSSPSIFIACSAVKAITVSSDGGKLKKVTVDDMLTHLAYDLKQPQYSTPTDKTATEESLHKTNNEEESSATPSATTTETISSQTLSIISDIIKHLSTSKTQLSQRIAYIIDSGGQPAYQELLPLFVRTASVNIITIDLSKGLDEQFECEFEINDKSFPLCKLSNKEIVERALLSQAVWKPLNFNEIKTHTISSNINCTWHT